MLINVNLSLTPAYQKTFRFFYLAILGLFSLGCYLLYANGKIANRWDNASIISVHLFTLGFLLPIFLGSITQLMPVLFGIDDFKIKTLDRLVISVPLISSFFLYSFHQYDLISNWPLLAALCVLWFGLLKFAYELATRTLKLYQAQNKTMHLHLFIATIYFVIALSASIWLILVHFGIPLPYFRPQVTNLHLILFVLGFFYHLIIAISQHIIPMFFITQPTPDKLLRRQLFMPVLLLLYFFTNQWSLAQVSIKVLITYLISEYLIQIFWNLKNRKRKNKDPVIWLWNLFILTVTTTLALWIFLSFSNEKNLENIELIIGGNLFLGIFLTLILAMLVKIIPFLLWQDLSRLQMEKMNFQISVPNLKEFISNKDIKIIFILLIMILISIYSWQLLFTGLLTIIIAMYLVYLIIMAQKLHQNAYMQLTNQS